jgi:hypothetical protein
MTNIKATYADIISVFGITDIQVLITAMDGVCSKLLRVDRSINEIHKTRALFSIEVFYKKNVSVYY